ncbi:MAG: glycerol-3-phosphate dehydrogenase [Alphaproteobacteria bacterium]|nr:glycerol-3-phosphate dehydrogenase [Alphaproteobacteria bacterium]
MREGSLDAPIRRPIDWQHPDYGDPAKIDRELRRVFEICHGCRRCFNLCDSFPRLFDLIDAAPSGEVEGVESAGFKSVVDACTLCDMCFMTKCPYVPPHEFDVDFPHLMLRARAAEFKAGERPILERQLTETDRNGVMGAAVAPIANWATRTGNVVTRPLMERVAGVHREAVLPKFHAKTFMRQAKDGAREVNRAAPAAGRKAVLYATCFVNYNNPSIGMAARAVLARNGVETEVAYPACCGMPQLEQGDIARVAGRARLVAAALGPWIDKGYDVIALVPSCALMLKFEWPLIVAGDPVIERLAGATFDISEYVVDIAGKEGLAPGLQPLAGGVTVHIACHARAQKMGQKASEMLRLVPDVDLAVVERCSGHGGAWGIMQRNFEVGMKVGRPVARQAGQNARAHLAAECPLAGLHIAQGMGRLDPARAVPEPSHPIELMALAYGLLSPVGE